MRRTNLVILILCLLGLLTVASGPAIAQQKIVGIDAVRMLYQQGKYAQAKQFAMAEIWKDMHQPEALYFLAMIENQMKQPEAAAVYATLYLRVAALEPTAGAKWKKPMEALLTRHDVKFQESKAEYIKSAAGKKFTKPEDVSDLWMTHVTSELHSLHGLYAWKLVGGRKNAKPDWIHNTKGEMHRSGMKYVDELDGRKGILFGVPLKQNMADAKDPQAQAYYARYKHPTQLKVENPGKGKILRIGTKGYGFPYLLRVLDGEKEIFTQTVEKEPWSDLKIPLNADQPPAALTLELTVPEGQQWMEGVWFDYIDFFED
jgi:hypothetical protein